MSPRLTGPGQRREFGAMGMQGRGLHSHPSLQETPIMIGSLVLHIVVQPALVFPWKPISNPVSLFYFCFLDLQIYKVQ